MGTKLDVSPVLCVGPALREGLQKRLDKARAAAADLGRPDAVHDFRKTIKRLRALLRLMEPVIGGAAADLHHATGELARALGQTRDVQAARDAADDLAAAKLISAATHASLRRRLETARRAAEDAVATADTTQRLNAGLDAAAGMIASWPLEDMSFADLADGLTRTYRRARRALPDDWAAADTDTLHRLRRRVIEHRYQMALVKPLWPELGQLWIEEAQLLRDDLGAHHDLVGLMALTGPGRPLARWRQRLAPLIAQRQNGHVAAAQRRSVRLFAERPKAFRRRITALWQAAAQTAVPSLPGR